MELKTVKYFFDPHPGLAGCIEPLPDAVKTVADELAGQSLPVEEVIARIQAACPDGDVRVSEKHEMVCLSAGDPIDIDGHRLRRCNWRVLRFRDANTAAEHK